MCNAGGRGGGGKGWLIRAQQPRRERISSKGQGSNLSSRLFRAQVFKQGSRTRRVFRSIYLHPSIYLSISPCFVCRCSNRAAERHAEIHPSISIDLSSCLYLPVSCPGLQPGQQNDTRIQIHLSISIDLSICLYLPVSCVGVQRGAAERHADGDPSFYAYIYLSIYLFTCLFLV